MNEDKNKTAPNPLSDWLDDKLIIVGLDKSSESKLRKNLETDLTKSFSTRYKVRRNEQNTKEKGGETA
tara:strand:- start:318 stop:521 length:204 start_codon:yes stop_codon:yes gene_type:complete